MSFSIWILVLMIYYSPEAHRVIKNAVTSATESWSGIALLAIIVINVVASIVKDSINELYKHKKKERNDADHKGSGM